MSENTFYLTTPIYYVNARPHIGHAYSTIVADVLARRHRLLGDETYFLTGTDEHGQKIERSAAAAGIPPQQFADQVSDTFKNLWKRMGITHDQFIRTTDPKHKLGAQQLFRTLYERGDIYLSSYTGQYSIGEEMFIEGPPGTLGPDGRPTETVTEENFFFRLGDYQLRLIDLIESGGLVITPESSKNEVLRFLTGEFRDLPDQHYAETGLTRGEADDADEWAKAVWDWARKTGKIKQSAAGTDYFPGALRDLSISRSSFTWGIPVPEDILTTENAKEKHVIYVWLDALANYITALGYGSEDTTLFDKFWPADIHLVGKEITRFHCVYWPAFLLAAGLPTPKQVTANGWLLFDNSKMSKSKGNVVRTETILEAFGTLCPPPHPTSTQSSVILSEGAEHHPAPQSKDLPDTTPATAAAALSATEPAVPNPRDRDLFAADVLRYYLLREIPFGQDGSFSFDSLITRYNADLANGYGNLVSRTLNLIQQNLEGTIVEPSEPLLYQSKIVPVPKTEFEFVAQQIVETNRIRAILLNTSPLDSHYDNCRFDQLASAILANVKIVDIYLSAHAPWKLAKSDDPEDRRGMVEVLYTAAESIRIITALLYPILPYATARVWKQLGFEKSIEQAALDGELKNLQWGGLQPGTKLGPLGPIFPRADKGLAQTMADIEEKLATGNSKLETESTNPQPPSTTSPDAGPRTASLTEPLTTLPVGGSAAHTTGPHATPSHTEAPASGIFANQPPAPLITNNQLLTTSPEITIDDFAKIELRVAEIKIAERIPKADKLLRLEVDLGELGQRQILSGIAEFYTPEELIGRRIIVITNLAPRKMRGLESHGMLLAASADGPEGAGGKPYLATVPEGVPTGTRLK